MKGKDEVDFHKLKMEDTLVKNCELVYSCFSEVYRLYIRKDEYQGFRALAIYNPHSDNTAESWEGNKGESLNVDIIFEASACFDGIRQLDFNPNINHPCLDRICSMIKKLRSIEMEICPDSDREILS